MFWGRIILNYSKTYRISLVNKDCLSLAVTSQPPSPAFIVSKSEGEMLCKKRSFPTLTLHVSMSVYVQYAPPHQPLQFDPRDLFDRVVREVTLCHAMLCTHLGPLTLEFDMATWPFT